MATLPTCGPLLILSPALLGLGQRRGGCPPPPYSPPNFRTPLGVTHWLAAAPVCYGKKRTLKRHWRFSIWLDNFAKAYNSHKHLQSRFKLWRKPHNSN